jgi:hypothetical protein
MGKCPSLVQRALDALIVRDYERIMEFFHKVFNTTVENFLSPRFFSEPGPLRLNPMGARMQNPYARLGIARPG